MRVGLLVLATTMVAAAGCARPAPSRTAEPSQDSAPSTQQSFKRITSAIRGSATSLLQQRTDRGGSVRGLDGIEELVHAGLSHLRADGNRAPQLAEAVPTLENGLWKLLPDGRMETAWKIKPAARWQDGTVLSTDDLLFAATVEQDKDLEIPPYAEYDLIESIAAPDRQTVVVTWKRPYIEADAMFSYRTAGLPVPKHLLERPYAEDKTSFVGLPYWNEAFVGMGAFKVHEWVRDSHTVLRVNDDYIFGRPKID